MGNLRPLLKQWLTDKKAGVTLATWCRVLATFMLVASGLAAIGFAWWQLRRKKLDSRETLDAMTEPENLNATMDGILLSAPRVLGELAREFTRRGDVEYRKDQYSQITACFFLALRSVSLLCGMGKVLDPKTSDGVKVLMRGFLEARDLLMTFRFDDQAIRNKVEL